MNDNWRITPTLSSRTRVAVRALVRPAQFPRRRFHLGSGARQDRCREYGRRQHQHDAFGNTSQIAAYTAGLWVTAREAGYPDNLYTGNGNWAPRVGVVYRPFTRDVVLRAGYGLFYNTITGNRTASAAVNPPFWGVESVSFSQNQLQPIETIWSADPNAFGIFSIWESQDPRIKPGPHAGVERDAADRDALPVGALTVSYVGTNVAREVNWMQYNAASIGPHDDLQADRPEPRLSDMNRLENFGRSWYHALQSKYEKRYSKGVTYTFSYSFSRAMGIGANGYDEYAPVLQYSPEWYNRGRAAFDIPPRRVRDLAVGTSVRSCARLWLQREPVVRYHRRRMEPDYDPAGQIGATALDRRRLSESRERQRNPRGRDWRPQRLQLESVDVVQHCRIHRSRSVYLWQLGSRIIEGPGLLQFNLGLAKQFRFTESKALEDFRGEAFNALNRANYGNPDTNVASGNFGIISSAEQRPVYAAWTEVHVLDLVYRDRGLILHIAAGRSRGPAAFL